MSKSTITCTVCGTVKTTSGSSCSSCGSLEESVAIQVDGAELRIEPGRVGTVTEERDISGEQFRIRTRTPEGARSDELLANGVVSLNIKGPTQMGRKGERRALDTLLSKLRQDGHHRRRVVYAVSLISNLRDYLLGFDSEPKYLAATGNEEGATIGIAEWWRERWLRRRIFSDEVLNAVAMNTLVRPIRHGARVAVPQRDEQQLPFAEPF